MLNVADDMAVLCREAKQLVKCGLKHSKQIIYNAAQKQFLLVCNMYSLKAKPATEDQLLCFVAFLRKRKFAASTLFVYIDAVRSLHMCEGHSDPTFRCSRLSLALCGLCL